MANKKILAIIPARGGSKGINNKNLTQVANKPLIAWTIEAALQSQFITKTIVSSDNDTILNVAKSYRAETIKRPDSLATDSAKTAPVILHVLEELIKDGEIFDYFILLQPTSPLRTAVDIDKAIEALLNSEATALISVNTPSHNPLKAFKVNNKGYLEGLVNNDYPFMPRQELPKVFYPNGAIYIVKTTLFLKAHKLFTDKTIAFEMTPDKSFDLDTKDDILNIEKAFKKNGK